jgi:cell wall-associated NlpC family hydrolase
MANVRNVLSLLCVASALALLLARPIPARADDNTPPPPLPAQPPTNTKLLLKPLPVVKARPRRRMQMHLSFGVRVVDFAKHFIGTRYTWGGTSPGSGFDCSGFVRYVYAHFGVWLPRTTYGQFDRGRRVSRWGLRPGDLVFFDGVGHVGMYVGGDRFIHAPHAGTRVQIQSLSGWYGSRFVGARRLRAY